MTNNEAGTPLEPWDNERIAWYVDNLTNDPWQARRLKEIIKKVVGEYEAARAADAQTIAQLRAQVAAANELIETLQGLYYGEGSTQPGGEGDNA